MVQPKAEEEEEAAMTAADDGDVLKTDAVEEMPFVPAGQRGSMPEPVDDTIVVVGQRKPKKRKRTGEKADTAGTAVTGEGSTSTKMEVEAFDYGTVSNILDDGSDHERKDARGGRKKRKQGQGEHCWIHRRI